MEKKARRKRKEPQTVPQINDEQFKKMEIAYLGVGFIKEAYPAISKAVGALVEQQHNINDFVAYLHRRVERVAKASKGESEKVQKPPIGMSKEEFLEMSSDTWDKASEADLEYMKGIAIHLSRTVPQPAKEVASD